MRTKTIEVVVCGYGRCSREGSVFRVIPQEGGDAFLIARCAQHEHKLRTEGGEQVATPEEEVEQDNEDLLAAIRAASGQPRKVYAAALGWNLDRTARAGSRLKGRGEIKSEGHGAAAVWVAA